MIAAILLFAAAAAIFAPGVVRILRPKRHPVRRESLSERHDRLDAEARAACAPPSDEQPTRRITSVTPLHDAIALEFARRELADDDKLAETIAGWGQP